MLQQRHDQLTMAIERRRPADDRHDAVGSRQLEQAFDVLVRHSLGERAKRELRVELVFESSTPQALVFLESLSREITLGQRVDQYVSGDRRAHEAVVDPAAGSGFDEAGGVTNDQQPLAICSRDTVERQYLLTRRSVVRLDTPS